MQDNREKILLDHIEDLKAKIADQKVKLGYLKESYEAQKRNTLAFREETIVLRKVIAKLRNRVSFQCENLNHTGGFYHSLGEDCPVEAMLKQALKEVEELDK